MSYMKNTLGENPLLSGTMGASSGMVVYDETTAIGPGSAMWVTSTPGGTLTISDTPPAFAVEKVKSVKLEAQCRLNKRTIDAYGVGHAKDIVKGRLVKELLAKLMDSGLVKITSNVSKTGAVTFTATVDVNDAP